MPFRLTHRLATMLILSVAYFQKTVRSQTTGFTIFTDEITMPENYATTYKNTQTSDTTDLTTDAPTRNPFGSTTDAPAQDHSGSTTDAPTQDHSGSTTDAPTHDTSGSTTDAPNQDPSGSTSDTLTSNSNASTALSGTPEPSANNTERKTTREPKETTSKVGDLTSSPPEEPLSSGAIAGIVIVFLAGTAAIVGGIGYAVIHCKSSSKVTPENDANKDIEIESVSNDTVKLTSPDND